MHGTVRAKLNEGTISAQAHVVLSHALRCKALLKAMSYATAIERNHRSNFRDGFTYAVHDISGHCLVNDLRHCTASKCNDGCAAGHGFNHSEPERF